MAVSSQDDMRSFDFSYSAGTEADGNESEMQLPFRLLVIGEFLPQQTYDDYLVTQPDTVVLRNFDRLLAAQNIVLPIALDDLHASAPCRSWFGQDDVLHITLHALEDFNPEMIAQREPTLARIQSLLVHVRMRKHDQRERGSINLADLSIAQRRLLGIPDEDTQVSRDVLELLLTDLAASLNELLNRIIHYPPLQKLEAAWRGLHWLVRTMGEHESTQVSFLPATLSHLRDDLLRSTDLTESHLFDVLYANEYGQFGGKPYGAVIADYAFELNDEDITLAKRLSRLGAIAHAPVIAQAAPSFFGVTHYADLASLNSLKSLQTGERHIKWRAFQDTSDANYLVLTLPRVLLRNPYSVASGNINASLYEEDIGTETPYTWGSAAYAMGTCLLRSFQRYGICTDITGEGGGEVQGLPHLHLKNTSENLLPVEVLLSENKEAELISMGFTPISVAKAQDKVLFYAANSVHWGSLQREEPKGVVQHLGAQLPYLFVILRIAHYLKMICRDMIGSVASIAELEAELQRWIKRYVSDVESPSAAVRARRPLKKVHLKVGPDAQRPDWLAIDLSVTPHMKYMDQDFNLNLVLNVISQR